MQQFTDKAKVALQKAAKAAKAATQVFTSCVDLPAIADSSSLLTASSPCKRPCSSRDIKRLSQTGLSGCSVF